MEFESLAAEGIKVLKPWFVLQAAGGKTERRTDALALKDPHYAKFTLYTPSATIQNVSRKLREKFVSNLSEGAVKPPPPPGE